jgi:hypothetical protein
MKRQHDSTCQCGWCWDMRHQAEFVRNQHKHSRFCHCGICFDERAQQEWLKSHPHQKPEADGQLPTEPTEVHD